jgi:hypothetical protein
MSVYNPSRFRAPSTYDLTWGSVFMGAADEVDPSGLEIETKEIKVGSMGQVPIGEWIIRLKGTLKAMLREIDIAQIQALMPWYTSGSIPLLPATFHKDMYAYAQILTVHPQDVSGTAEDITLLKAVPTFKKPKRKGDDEATALETEWRFWPDRAQLTTAGSPVLAYGYIGPVPS